MWTFIIDFIYKLVSSKMVRSFIEKGLRKLVGSTDNGIDDALLDIILTEAVQSKLNGLTQDNVDQLKEYAKQKDSKQK